LRAAVVIDVGGGERLDHTMLHSPPSR
jgi:hypothetical protein